MSDANAKTILYRVRRYDPAREPAPRWQDFTIPRLPGMTVLDGLWTIKETQDASLAWRSSCRMGVCGSCGMVINGKARLGCNTQVSELSSDVVAVAPLPNFDIIRDLVPDLAPMFDAHVALRPYVIREDVKERENPSGEFGQSMHELEQYLQFSYCIKCGCCMAACPTYATDPVYSGPMPLAQAHRYNTDTRDGGFEARKDVLGGERGPWRCHFAGECSRVCPKGVDPAKAIQLMKRELVLDYIHLRKGHAPAQVNLKPKEGKRRPDVPEAPAKTL
jgi:succinate dehydrogenase / fumarate reductase iron-sulfur subunit